MDRTFVSNRKPMLRATIAAILLLFALNPLACKHDSEVESSKVAENQFVNGFKSADPIVSISAVELLHQVACKHAEQGVGGTDGAAPKPSVARLQFEKDQILAELKRRLVDASEWERLEILQALISCRAEGINVTVIDQFREERSPAILQQIVEIVAMNANLPLQREIGARALRASDKNTRILAYNLILEPYFASQVKLKESERREGLVERLTAQLDSRDPIILAKNIRYLNELGEDKYADSYIEAVENDGLTVAERLKALSVLAISGTRYASNLFDRIIRQNRLDVDQKRGPKEDPKVSSEAVRWAKLGEIATGARSVSGITKLIDMDDLDQVQDEVEVLISNGSPEALDMILQIMDHSNPDVTHNIVSSLFHDNDWSVNHIAKMLEYATPTDRLVIVRYLEKKKGELWQEVFTQALREAKPEKLGELLNYLRHTMMTPEKVLKVATLKGELEALEGSSRASKEEKEEIRSMLKLIEQTQTKKFPTLDEFKKLPLEEQFQIALIGLQLGALDSGISEMLQTSDNSFLRLVSHLYRDPS